MWEDEYDWECEDDEDNYMSLQEIEENHRQKHIQSNEKLNWLGDPWPYVAGDPAY